MFNEVRIKKKNAQSRVQNNTIVFSSMIRQDEAIVQVFIVIESMTSLEGLTQVIISRPPRPLSNLHNIVNLA